MSIPDQFLPLLRRPSLELHEILFFAYGLNLSSWPLAPTEQLRDEILSLHHEIKEDIDRFKDSGGKTGLQALVRGNDANKRSSVLQSDFVPYVTHKAAIKPQRWAVLLDACDQWQSEYDDAPPVTSTSKERDDALHVRKLEKLKSQVLVECPQWPRASMSMNTLAGKLAKRGVFGLEVLANSKWTPRTLQSARR